MYKSVFALVSKSSGMDNEPTASEVPESDDAMGCPSLSTRDPPPTRPILPWPLPTP